MSRNDLDAEIDAAEMPGHLPWQGGDVDAARDDDDATVPARALTTITEETRR